MNKPRKHHFLPQFYLRRFSLDGRRLFQVEKGSGRSYSASIRDIAAIRDYHVLDHQRSDDVYAAERKISDFEEAQANELKNLLESGISEDGLPERLIEFVSLMRFRVPSFRSHIENSLRQIIHETARIIERNGQLPPVPKGLESVLSVDSLRIQISNWKCLEHMFKVAFAPEILKLLASMRPSLLSVPEGCFFLTCDQPVALFHPAATPNDIYGVGLIDPAVELSIPLSSRILLLLSWDKNRHTNQVLDHSEVNEFNRRTIIMAQSYIFSPEVTDQILDSVSQYRNCFGGFELQTIDAPIGPLQISKFKSVMSPSRYRALPPI